MISMINCGSGNIAALITMILLSNFDFEVIDSADQIRSAGRLLLAGVGAFNNTKQTVKKPGICAPNFDLIEGIADERRMPFCYGGGITTAAQADKIFELGVERVSVGDADVQSLIDLVGTAGRRQAAFSFSKGNIELFSLVTFGLQVWCELRRLVASQAGACRWQL
jgi:Histidine biosynthesis protein